MSTLRSSQISIYNYPEHLNPFFEDDQHKRIRFFKVKKEEKEKPFSGRRGSFNFGSLKDLLPLRSFRLKKKSSTLGVNKTSESPPVIRREAFSENLSAYDPKNRVSLENIFANRNSRYRSTIGPSATSFTPTPRSRYTFNNGMTPGSSMNSVASTNPFETDDEASVISRSMLTVAGGEHKRYRKKRRAPLPPERQTDPMVQEDIVLRIDEPSGSNDGLEELSRLTAEFENFVKVCNEDDVINNNVSSHDFEHHQTIKNVNVTEAERKTEVENRVVVCNGIKPSAVTSVDRQAVQMKEEESVKHVVICNGSNPGEVCDEVVVTSVNDKQDSEVSTSDKLKISEENHEPVKDREVSEAITKLDDEILLKILEENHKTVDEVISNNEETNQRIVSKDVIIREVSSPVAEFRRETTVHREETPEYIPLPVREKFQVLKIEEPEVDEKLDETVIVTQAIIEEPKVVEKIPIATTERLHIREESTANPERLHIREESTANPEINQRLSSQGFVRVEKPIEFYEPIETFIRRTSVSESDEAPKPPERRRSVKDIIESINRNQKLLKINQTVVVDQENNFERYSYRDQPLSRDKPPVPSKHNLNLKLKRQAEHEQSINRLLDDLNDFDKQNSNGEKPQSFPCDDDKPDVTFEKCKVKADHENNNLSSVNPIAKPRRAAESKEWL